MVDCYRSLHPFFRVPHLKCKIRSDQKYERDMFADFGGATGVARVMTGPGKVQTFMEQEPRKVHGCIFVGVPWNIGVLKPQT